MRRTAQAQGRICLGEESDIESANERETECNEAIEEDFNGFSAQEDDGYSDQ